MSHIYNKHRFPIQKRPLGDGKNALALSSRPSSAPGSKDGVLVSREGEDWVPLESLDQLGEVLRENPAENLRVWKDSRQGLFRAGDGRVSEDELSAPWGGEKEHKHWMLDSPGRKLVYAFETTLAADTAGLEQSNGETPALVLEEQVVRASYEQQIKKWGGWREPTRRSSPPGDIPFMLSQAKATTVKPPGFLAGLCHSIAVALHPGRDVWGNPVR